MKKVLDSEISDYIVFETQLLEIMIPIFSSVQSIQIFKEKVKNSQAENLLSNFEM